MITAGYYALVYFTVTGQVIGEIPLTGIPQWTQQINADGSWSIQTLIGPDDRSSGLSKADIRAITDPWRCSIAICWGTGSSNSDYVCQAGPITARQLMTEQPPVLQIGGTGAWPLFRKIMQFAATWNRTSLSSGVDTTYGPAGLPSIAAAMLTNALNRQTLPIDAPTVTSTGTTTETYYGFDFTSSGQRLQELTQLMSGPDIMFKPYRTSNTVRFAPQIGNPTISNAGRPLVFDYPTNVPSILPTENATTMSTTTYEKGSGSEYASLWTSTTDTTLTNGGWPMLEVADSTHASETNLTTLQQWSDATQQLNGRPIITWAAVAQQNDVDYPFGSYDPGVYATYNVLKHAWLPDGAYNNRILGFQQGQKIGQFVHLLQSTTY